MSMEGRGEEEMGESKPPKKTKGNSGWGWIMHDTTLIIEFLDFSIFFFFL